MEGAVYTRKDGRILPYPDLHAPFLSIWIYTDADFF